MMLDVSGQELLITAVHTKGKTGAGGHMKGTVTSRYMTIYPNHTDYLGDNFSRQA